MFDGKIMSVESHFSATGYGDDMSTYINPNALSAGAPALTLATNPQTYLTANHQLSANAPVAPANYRALGTSSPGGGGGGMTLPAQHSQCPTPSSTPPAPTNDLKTGISFQPHNSYQHIYAAPVRPPLVPAVYQIRNHTPGGGRVVTNPHLRSPIYLSVPAIPTNNMPCFPITQQTIHQNTSATSVNQALMFTNPNENVMLPRNNSNLQEYNNYRPPNWNIRGTNTTQLLVPSAVTQLQYPSSTTLSPITSTNKQPKRSHAVPIIDPVTREEVTLDEDSSQNKASSTIEIKKNPEDNRIKEEFSKNVIKRANEPSNLNTSMSVKPLDTKDSITNVAVISSSSTEQNISYSPVVKSIPTTTNITGNLNSNNTASEKAELVINDLKNSNATCTTLQPSNDFKRPIRENQNIVASSATVVNNESHIMDSIKPSLDKPSLTCSNKPEPTMTFPSTHVTSSAIQRPQVQMIPKKISKEPPVSAAVTSLSFGSSPSPTVGISPVASTTNHHHTSSNDGINKAVSVTSNSVVLSDINEVPKKVTKQGIQTTNSGFSSSLDESVSSLSSTTTKETVPVKQAAFASTAATSSQSLPEVSHSALMASIPSSAQITNSKLDSTSNKFALNSQNSSSSSSVNVVNSKSSTASTLHNTTLSVSDKPSTMVTQSNVVFCAPPFSQKSTVVHCTVPVTPQQLLPPVTEKISKEEKLNPSSKTKSRGKELDNDTVNVDSSFKNKSAQSFSKSHIVETGKQQMASVTSVVSKQTNGETTESQNTLEDKKSKKKKSSRKELNKKGSDKEGSDMDMFTNIEKTSNIDKPLNNEKLMSSTNPDIINNSSNNRPKTNSSQRAVEEFKENISVEEQIGNINKITNIPPSTVSLKIHNAVKTVEEKVSDEPKGKRKYSIQYLLELRNQPQCRQKVPFQYTCQGLEADHSSMIPSRSSSQNGFISTTSNTFLPSFMHQAPRNSMTLPPRNSQQGSMKRDRQNPIHLSLSLREEVQLRQTKDAWKPARFNAEAIALSEEEKKTQELCKKVNSILNKLTPEKFEKLLIKFKALLIDTSDRLQKVIDLIFEKAIDEPGFCRCYAEMCINLQEINVVDNTDGKKTFRTLIINKCQEQFERNQKAESEVAHNKAEMDNCTDPEKKKELQLLYEEAERKVRRRSVGNCRFIGELFKLKMLTAKIMSLCITNLLDRHLGEESLECLCKLLTTIGKDLEQKTGSKALDQYFSRMQEISEKKVYKISSRIRFMLQDVIDLRRNAWIPRRETDNPKTIDQINMELDQKEHESRAFINSSRSRDDYFPNKNKDFKKIYNRGSQNEDDWKTVSNRSNNYSKPPTFKVDVTRLSVDIKSEEILAPSFQAMWSKGASSTKMGDKKNQPSFIDNKASLRLSSSVTNPRNYTSKVTPSSSMEKPKSYSYSANFDDNSSGKISRSGSTQNINPASRDSSLPRSAATSRNSSQTAAAPAEKLTPEMIERYAKTILEEYVNDNDLKETIMSVECRFNPKQMKDVVDALTSLVINYPKWATKCGEIVTGLYKKKIITLEHITDGLSNTFEYAQDIIIDCPKMWSSLVDMLSALFTKDCLPFNEFESTIITRFPNEQNGELLPALRSILKNNSKGSNRQFEGLKLFLLENLLDDNSEKITKWIDENFKNSRNNPDLVHALTTSVCELCYRQFQKPKSHINSDGNSEDNSEDGNDDKINKLFSKCSKYFKIYIENKGDLEMQCLTAVQEYVNKRDFPPGLHLKICEALYDLKLISFESFIQWKENPSLIDRKGVAIMQLTAFFEYISSTDQEIENQSG